MPLKIKSKESRQKVIHRLSAGIGLIWLGMILGISFLETPLKFRAPSVSLEIGLDIGRYVFGAFNQVECALALVMVKFVLIIRLKGRWLIPLGAVWLSLVLQTVWLLPILNARVELIVQGQTPGPSFTHTLYVVLEILKAIALTLYGFGNLLIEQNKD
jgi:carbon starvation protein CstA